MEAIETGLNSLNALVQMYQHMDAESIEVIKKVGLITKELYNLETKIYLCRNRFVLVGLKFKRNKLKRKLKYITND